MAAKGSPSKHAEDNLGSWGHEFVRSLAGEIGQEYNARVIDGDDPDTDEPFKDILGMVNVIVPFHVTHNAEAEAVDLLIEVQRLKTLLEVDAVNDHNYSRICMYLVKTADYMSEPDDYTVSLFLVLKRAYFFLPTPNTSASLTGNARDSIRNLPKAEPILRRIESRFENVEP